MNFHEKRLYLIKYLLSENPSYNNIAIPSDEENQKNLLRSLFNMREPKAISDEFLNVQNLYLKEEISKRCIVDCSSLKPIAPNSKIYLWQGDITTLKINAIVNAANSALLGCFVPIHSCIDNIIHTLSGVQLRLYCNEIMQKQGHAEPTGSAKITPAFNLPCDYILHTVGPIISTELTKKHEELLANCYKSCLEVAAQNNVKSIAFCCISTGEFRFPQERAAQIATKTVSDFLKCNNKIEKVVFNVFTDKDLIIYQNILGV